ncbi:hypothetical protein [Nonomuraea antri]|uniref:hypothetical protein n=1 Tax=Nonomuraea antri TaxID=2730852 RepID=UPI002E291F50|nr:hypothetical protein [Nonomuraea antri]
MRLRFSRGVITIAIIVVVLAVGVSAGIYFLLKKVPQPLAEREPRCVVTTPGGSRDLELEQAQIAATIAAVATRRKLPERALIIAYATAIQESKIKNLDYGDRDSVGVFQQRESQGWGSKKQIMDPVYATNKFFAALEKVKNYRKLPVAEAAQAVQRSAGGYAYAPHEDDAKILAQAFTGRVPKAVQCWYPPGSNRTPGPKGGSGDQADSADQVVAAKPAELAAGRRQLTRELGSTAITGKRRGWLIAAWWVAHAEKYGLRQVGYAGATWTNDVELAGWKPGGSNETKIDLT